MGRVTIGDAISYFGMSCPCVVRKTGLITFVATRLDHCSQRTPHGTAIEVTRAHFGCGGGPML